MILRCIFTILSIFAPFPTFVRGGENLFLEALAGNCVESLERRIREGEDINYRRLCVNRGDPTFGMNPLMIATRRGHTHVVRYLLDRNADVNIQEGDGNTALHIAINYKLREITLMLLEKPFKILYNKYGDSVLHLACASPLPFFTEVTKKILEKVAVKEEILNHKDEYGNTALINAMIKGSKESAIVLINAGADIRLKKEPGLEPIHYACMRCGFTDIVELLLNKGIDVNDDFGSNPPLLLITFSSGPVETIDFLLEKGADVHIVGIRGYTLLHLCARKWRGDIAKYVGILLEKNLNIDAQCDFGNTPLMVALEWNNTGVAWELLKNGADPTIPNQHLEFPIHLASAGKDMSDILEFLSEKVDVNAETADGNTALYIAAKYCMVDNLKVLISKGADVNDKALMSAALCVDEDEIRVEETVALLIDAGARLGNAAETEAFVTYLKENNPCWLRKVLRVYPEDFFYSQLLDDIVRNEKFDDTVDQDEFQKHRMKLAEYLLGNGADFTVKASDTLNLIFEGVIANIFNAYGGNFEDFLNETIRVRIIMKGMERTFPKDIPGYTKAYLKCGIYALYRILLEYYREMGGKNLISLQEYEASVRRRTYLLNDHILMEMCNGTYLDKVPTGVLYDILDNVTGTFVRVKRKIIKLARTLALVEKTTKELIVDEKGVFKYWNVVGECFPSCNKEE